MFYSVFLLRGSRVRMFSHLSLMRLGEYATCIQRAIMGWFIRPYLTVSSQCESCSNFFNTLSSFFLSEFLIGLCQSCLSLFSKLPIVFLVAFSVGPPSILLLEYLFVLLIYLLGCQVLENLPCSFFYFKRDILSIQSTLIKFVFLYHNHKKYL